jgi:hypothetical protein
LSYSPELQDKGSNLDLHVQSVVSCQLDDPGPAERRSGATPSSPIRARRNGDRGSADLESSVTSRAKRTLFSVPLANPSTLDHRRRVRVLPSAASYVEGLWSPSLDVLPDNSHAKADTALQRDYAGVRARVFLSQAGPRFDLALLQAGHHPLSLVVYRLRNDEGDPSGRPRVEQLCA